jgi:hypothetical protein
VAQEVNAPAATMPAAAWALRAKNWRREITLRFEYICFLLKLKIKFTVDNFIRQKRDALLRPHIPNSRRLIY